MARHGLVLGNVCHQFTLSEEANEYIEGALEPLHIPRSHHDIAGVKYSQKMPHYKYKPIMGDQFFFQRQQKPILHPILHIKIKEGGRYDTSLGCPPSPLEFGGLVFVFTGNDLFLLPKTSQETAHMWPSTIALQVCQETDSFNSVIGFSEVQKTQTCWVLINAIHLLRSF